MRRRGIQAALAAACALAATLAPATGRANNLDLFGYGLRGVSMGGAVVATASGHESVYYNPGGLAFDVDLTFSLAYQEGSFDLELNGAGQEVASIPALVLGFGVPIPLGGWLKERLALGLGFVIPRTSVLVADIPPPGEPRFALLESRGQTVSLQAALGLRLTDELGIGGGVLALAELEGAIDVAPNSEGRVGASVRDSIVADYSPVLGVQWHPRPWLAAGVAFRGESEANFSVPITVALGDSFNIPVPTLLLEGTAQYDPRQVGAEVAWRPAEGATLGLGVTWKQWSRFPNPIRYASVPADFPAQPSPDFEDTLVWRLGGEWPLPLPALPLRLIPRAGFTWEPTPAPLQTGYHGYLDNDRAILCLGLGTRWENLRLDLGGQLHLLSERRATKEQPPEDGPASWTHGGSITFYGAELGVTF